MNDVLLHSSSLEKFKDNELSMPFTRDFLLIAIWWISFVIWHCDAYGEALIRNRSSKMASLLFLFVCSILLSLGKSEFQDLSISRRLCCSMESWKWETKSYYSARSKVRDLTRWKDNMLSYMLEQAMRYIGHVNVSKATAKVAYILPNLWPRFWK